MVRAMLVAVDHKKWLVEIVIGACLLAVAIGAFYLMGGQALWTILVHKQ